VLEREMRERVIVRERYKRKTGEREGGRYRGKYSLRVCGSIFPFI